MGDEDNVAAIKEALIANGPKTAPIDPRFPNTNQVRPHILTTAWAVPFSGLRGTRV